MAVQSLFRAAIQVKQTNKSIIENVPSGFQNNSYHDIQGKMEDENTAKQEGCVVWQLNADFEWQERNGKINSSIKNVT